MVIRPLRQFESYEDNKRFKEMHKKAKKEGNMNKSGGLGKMRNYLGYGGLAMMLCIIFRNLFELFNFN